jgi:hypothetical protein
LTDGSALETLLKEKPGMFLLANDRLVEAVEAVEPVGRLKLEEYHT